jgi:hypothetical protein
MVVAARELTDPVTYSAWLLVLAVALPVLVVAWYAGVTWWAREKRDGAGWRQVARARRDHLRRLDKVEAAVATGEMTPRSAHQQISVLVRSYVDAVSSVETRSMALEQLRATAPAEVADVVALIYPPAFQPGDQGEPAARLDPALHDARAVVATWRP